MSNKTPLKLTLQALIWYKIKGWQRSSVVEQGTHKPLVSGPNPLVATIFYLENNFEQKGESESKSSDSLNLYSLHRVGSVF
jgi:hypothetical protein